MVRVSMGLEHSIVFRQLEHGSRFSRFDHSDAVLGLLPFNIHYLLELFSNGSLARPWVTLLAAGVGIYFFRMKFPDGLAPLLHVMLTPHHLSALAEDNVLRPYPVRKKEVSP